MAEKIEGEFGKSFPETGDLKLIWIPIIIDNFAKNKFHTYNIKILLFIITHIFLSFLIIVRKVFRRRSLNSKNGTTNVLLNKFLGINWLL